PSPRPIAKARWPTPSPRCRDGRWPWIGFSRSEGSPTLLAPFVTKEGGLRSLCPYAAVLGVWLSGAYHSIPSLRAQPVPRSSDECQISLAASRGDLASVKRLLTKNPDLVNSKDKFLFFGSGITPLQ